MPKSWNTSDLRESLLSFVGMARPSSPQEQTDAVNARAARFQSPQFGLTVPAGCFTSCASVVLPANQPETAQIDLSFLQPVMLVGIHFDLSPDTFNGFTSGDPKLRDVYLKAELPMMQTYLAQRTVSPSFAGVDGFAPLSAMDIGARLLMLPIDDRTEVVRMTFRGRYATTGTSGFGQSLIIDATAVWMPQ